MPVPLHHIVVDAHDPPGLARFWTQALGWKVLSERENEIVIGTGQNAPVGMCFMPVTDPKTVKNRVQLGLTTSAADRDQEIDRLLALAERRVDIGRAALSPGPPWPTPRETSSVWCARRKASSVKSSSGNGTKTLHAADPDVRRSAPARLLMAVNFSGRCEGNWHCLAIGAKPGRQRAGLITRHDQLSGRPAARSTMSR
jgi:hypothetical protein